jgi:NAD-dependent histone deacetylase SIR2
MKTLSLSHAEAEALARLALTDLSKDVARARKILIITGAGISCSSGVPVGLRLMSETKAASDVRN